MSLPSFGIPQSRSRGGSRRKEAEARAFLAGHRSEATRGLKMVEWTAGKNFYRFTPSRTFPPNPTSTIECIGTFGYETETVMTRSTRIHREIAVTLPITQHVVGIMRRLNPTAVG